jgi:hypothetical protein
MEKNLSQAEAASFTQGESEQQPPLSSKDSFPDETPLPSKRVSQQQFSFVVRLSKSERATIDNLGRDFSESLVTIFTKSIRLYRAIAEATDQGGSLIMSTDKSGASLGAQGICHGVSDPGDQLIQGRSRRKFSNVSVSVVGPPSGNDTLDGLDLSAQELANTINSMPHLTAEEQRLTNNRKLQFHDINEAIIAVRDQFADNCLAPISLNPLYISAPKGWKTEKITLKTDASFANRLSILEKKTGLKKSVIVRDAVQLYDFVKRKFQDTNISFYIGGIPIAVI